MLDAGLEDGATLRLEIVIGKTGPTGVSLVAINAAGETRQLVYVAAPRAATPFKFGAAQRH